MSDRTLDELGREVTALLREEGIGSKLTIHGSPQGITCITIDAWIPGRHVEHIIGAHQAGGEPRAIADQIIGTLGICPAFSVSVGEPWRDGDPVRTMGCDGAPGFVVRI